jgi:hypothetical protein
MAEHVNRFKIYRLTELCEAETAAGAKRALEQMAEDEQDDPADGYLSYDTVAQRTALYMPDSAIVVADLRPKGATP